MTLSLTTIIVVTFNALTGVVAAALLMFRQRRATA
jgi:hypothetical protein